MNVSPEVVAQITRDFDLVGVDARRGRRLRSCLYYIFSFIYFSLFYIFYILVLYTKTPNRV